MRHHRGVPRAITATMCAALLVVMLLTSCARKTNVQLADNLSPGWKVQIIQVSEPKEAMVLRRDPGVGVPIGVPAAPAEDDNKWLVVTLNVTPPPQPTPSPSPQTTGIPGGVVSPLTELSKGGDKPSLKFDGIKLVSPEGAEYAADAISTGGMWKGNDQKEISEFVDPKNGEPVFKDASGKLLMGYQLGWLTFFRNETQQVAFLFAVPKRAPILSLRL